MDACQGEGITASLDATVEVGHIEVACFTAVIGDACTTVAMAA